MGPHGVLVARVIQRKEKDPVWTPPEWHYAEVASKRGLRLADLSTRKPTPTMNYVNISGLAAFAQCWACRC